MKKVSLVIVYILGLIVCLVFRFVQITQMINPETGFLLSEYENTNYIIYGLVGVFILILVLIGVVSDGLPKKTHGSTLLGVSSIFLGIICLVMTVQLAFDFKVEVGLIIYITASFAFSIFLMYFGYCKIAEVKVASGTAVIPVIFAGVRLAIVFLDYYGLAKTIDIVIETIMLIVCLLFWHYFSKYEIGIKPDSTSRWLIGFALGASLLCFVCTVPIYYARFFTEIESVREIAKTSYFDLATGVYIIIFLLTSLGKKGKTKEIHD